MIKVGQIYKEINIPYYRKNDKHIFVVSRADYDVDIIYNDGKTDRGGLCWIKEDCKLIAEYPTWQEAVNSKEFKENNYDI